MNHLTHDQQLLRAILRTDFASFIRKVFTTVSPGSEYSDNWHIHALAWHLEQVRLGQIRRLIIAMPPRSLKSIAASVALPAYMLGHDPSSRIICASYSSDLAGKHSADCRRVLGANWYQESFPVTRIGRRKDSVDEFTTTRQGFRLSTSVGGTLTGRGGDLIIVDDPLKAQDAYSDSKRENANEWFSQTVPSRLDDPATGAIIIVMQRVHAQDLVGHLLEHSSGWTVLNLPAIAQQDEAIQIGPDRYHLRKAGDLLHAEREPLDVLERHQREMGEDQFAAQYLQAPVPPGGHLIKREWVQRYEHPPAKSSSSRIIQSWDTATKVGPTNDYSVCTTWLEQDNRFYLLHVERGRYDYPALKMRVLAAAEEHRANVVLIEDAGTGQALIQELRYKGPAMIAIKPEGDKRTRMAIEADKFRAGRVFLPMQASWLAELERELFAFPQSRHDDQIDSVSQAIRHGKRRLSMIDVL